MGMLQAWSGWRSYRKLPADWRNIVIYSESGQDWHYFESLVMSLNEKLRKKVTYVTSDGTDPGLDFKHELFKAICLPEGLFRTIFFQVNQSDVFVLTMMDL